ncbi:flagellar hook capping FlgD N-terminal domain-containing protein [Chitinivibrio alkaliphilus]|uniref:Basal-body rod modification protein FlgD n=1 Tax=Chitinivibrio alkaliphilus ACht1 TaxID=1313304 RepID=U7DAC1_9BACT|nr:flagellar hook capping FlgD N-terminal domain-containing protein [Chitinivibrio alkaliphilus]ERP32082.1 flagellar hook capping protein FlgD [Chitinivibrio alkaliphilus ACht1]
MTRVSESVNNMFTPKKDPYSVTAGIGESGLETKKVTGDRDSDTFVDPSDHGMGQDEFLFLLTEQMRHQDPLDPMDNREFVTQLAQFSQLESSTNMRESLQDMNKSFQSSLDIQNNTARSMNNASAVSLVGKEVRLLQDTMNWTGNTNQPYYVQMGSHDMVHVEIVDREDEVVDTIEVERGPEGNAGVFTWDGVTAQGDRVDFDQYKLRVRENKNSADELYCFVQDTVTGLRYTGDGAKLQVADREIGVSNILEVSPQGGDTETDSPGFSGLTMGQALNLVGKDVRTSVTPSYRPSPNNTEATYRVDLNGAPQANLVVRDSEGVVVQQQDVRESGEVTVPLFGDPDEEYTVSLEGSDEPFFYMDSTVTGVRTTPQGVQLSAGGRLVRLDDIIELSAKS